MFRNFAHEQRSAVAALLHVEQMKRVATWEKAQVHFEFCTVEKGKTGFVMFAPLRVLRD